MRKPWATAGESWAGSARRALIRWAVSGHAVKNRHQPPALPLARPARSSESLPASYPDLHRLLGLWPLQNKSTPSDTGLIMRRSTCAGCALLTITTSLAQASFNVASVQPLAMLSRPSDTRWELKSCGFAPDTRANHPSHREPLPR